ncbi:Os08g0331000, partial [Oryza sativa Japonica Group]
IPGRRSSPLQSQKEQYCASVTMAKNLSTSVQLLLVLIVLLAFVGGILGGGGPSSCSNNPAVQHSCPPIPGRGH